MTDEILLDKIIGEKIRSYEVSIWTLQDSFITVLKWADLENKGQIQEPKMVLDIDGTQEFTFSIPMYLMSITNEYDVDFQTTRTFEDRVENPIWYNTNNGNLMVSLRKIKVILNKKTDDEKVYEFMITKVEERHENGELFCDVSCEGLTFHELGKVGFKLTLNNDEYEYDYKQWEEKTVGAGKDFTTQAAKDAAKPRENLQYWCDKFLTPLPEGDIANGSLNPSIWYYDVQLRYPFQNETTSTIYDMGHVTAWDSNGKATASVGPQEKYRPVDIKESNYYNATQTIAEAFEVYCRYEYIYDDTYHIIGRRVIFYNNFLEEEKGVFDITYPYQTSSITKEMDSTDLVTKLFVKPVDYEYSESGQLDIMSVDANKSREDYILNFDYLHDIGTISDEQYKAIDTYETKMHNINLELESISRKRRAYVYIKDEYDPKLTVAKNAITEASEEISTAKKELKNLGTGSSSPKFTKDNSKYLIIKKSNKLGYYVNLIEGEKGARASTIKMYDKNPSPTYYVEKTINGTTKKVYDGDQLQFTISYDKFGLVSSLNHIKYDSTVTGKNVSELSGIYLTYTYNPTSYWKGVRRYWEVVHATNTSLKAEYEELLGVKNSNGVWVGNYKGTQNNPDGGINKLIEDCDTAYDAKIEEKNTLIDKFQRMMGPALREGYWQPEDYEDYGDSESFSISMFTSAGFANSSGSSSNTVRYKYDDNKLTDEEDITFEYGANRTKYRHILIDITSHIPQIKAWLNGDESRQISDLSFVYCDRTLLGDALEVIGKEGVTTEELSAAQQTVELSRRDLHINGESCKLACVKLGTNDRKLVLVLTDTSDFLETQVLSNGDIQVSAKGIYNHYKDDLDNLVGKSFSNLLDEGKTLSFSDYIIYPRISYVEYDETANDTWQETTVVDNIIADDIKCGYNKSGNNYPEKSSWYSVRFPRLIFNTLKIKTGDTLKLTYNDTILENYSEYQVFTHQDEYYVTLKPSIFIKYYSSNANTLLVNYTISNADDAIYMDAISVEKENAYPKVSYTVELNIFDSDKIKTVYNKLGQIIHINDYELKFKNVQGYISRVEMDLDQPDNDTVEVKNYKTKFEDLFSTIVAQTEAMKKTSFGSSVIAAALNPDGSQTANSFYTTINNATNRQTLIDFLNTYFDGSDIVHQQLKSLFDDAGAILKDSANSLGSVINLNSTNAQILAGFVSDVRSTLTPTVYTGEDEPTNFKVGDVWVNGNYVGIATSPSSAEGGYSQGHFTRTYNGTIAQIKGAAMEYDAQAGTVDITAENEINIATGGYLHLTGENVEIVGNNTVDIGGTTINIASVTRDGTTYGAGGINLVASSVEGVTSSTSKVLISPTKIEMGASDIIMKGANSIQISTSDGTVQNTGAISINPLEGIYIASGNGIKFYAGNAGTQNNDNTWTLPSDGASVEINKDHLIFGIADTVANGGTSTAIEMTKEQIILAAGSNINAIKSIVSGTITDILDANISGVQIKNDYIGMATGTLGNTNSPRSIISLTPGKIVLGQINSISNGGAAAEDYTGSYVWLSKGEVYIGSVGTNGSLTDTGNFTLNTNNIKIQTKLMRPEAGNARATASTEVPLVTTMGFCLGKNLQGDPQAANPEDQPKPAFGFWMDRSNGAHLYVDATDIRLNGDPVTSQATILTQVPVNIQKLYKAHSSKASNSAPTPPTGVNWNILDTNTYNSADTGPFVGNGWTTKIASPTTTDKYIWSITQYVYKVGSNYKYMAKAPVYEGLIDQINTNSYKEYKYFAAGTAESTVKADTDAWSMAIPTASTSYQYVIGDDNNVCTQASNITTTTTLSNTGLTASNWRTIRQVTENDIKVTYTTINSSGTGTEHSKTCKKGDWFAVLRISVSGNYVYYWGSTTSVKKRTTSGDLWSRLHTININGGATNTNYQKEDDLKNMSNAAKDAWNIASGAIPVSSVQSSGLTVDGDNVLLGSTGKLMLLGNAEVFIGTSSSNSAVVLNKSGISIGSGADIGIAANGSITIASGGSISINSGSTININSTNFKVNSAAENDSNIFYVGDSSGNIKYTKKSDGNILTIKGSITANSGEIGGWKIGSDFIGNGTSKAVSSVAIRSSSTGGDTVFWAGHAIETTNSETGITSQGNTHYFSDSDFAVKADGTLKAAKGTIGGWTFTSTGGLVSGSSSAYVALNSNSGNDYAIWAGAESAASGKFRVKRDGKVYLNELMVLDHVTDGKWELTGLAPANNDGHEGVKGSGNNKTGYYPIDFSSLNFKNAISLSLVPDGNEIKATANLWGKFSKSLSKSATVDIDYVSVDTPSAGQAAGTATAFCRVSINGTPVGSYVSQNVDCFSTIPYNAGWDDCVDWCNQHKGTYYTRSYGSYSTPSLIHYIATEDGYQAIGTGWYKTTAAEACEIPKKQNSNPMG